MSAFVSTIWTVGHSNQTAKEFIALLQKARIDVVVDVRANPRSGFVPWANRANLKELLREQGFVYHYGGHVLGAPSLLDDVSEERFEKSIEWLESAAKKTRIALMCAEENPENCHRRKWVGVSLRDHGVELLHIRKVGVVSDCAYDPRQGELFA